MASADTLLTAQPPTRDPSAPNPSAASPSRIDALTDLFDFSDDENRNTANNNTTAPQNATSDARNRASREDGGQGIGLGIDEEIKIRKPRKPIAKLDIDRLLSQKGIPKLRKVTKERLKFKGKGHEFTDVAQLLTTYQLWLDDLFPKANFLDGLSMIEKLGHTNHMRVMRRAWIDEEKAQNGAADDDADADFVEKDPQDEADPDMLWGQRTSETTANNPESIPVDGGVDDIYSAPTGPAQNRDAPPADQSMGDVPDEDELDALMAEDAVRGPDISAPLRQAQPPAVDDFADDEEAMAGMW